MVNEYTDERNTGAVEDGGRFFRFEDFLWPFWKLIGHASWDHFDFPAITMGWAFNIFAQ